MVGALFFGAAQTHATAGDMGDEITENFEVGLSLNELLRAMKKKLAGESIQAEVRASQGTLRVMTDIAHFPLSKADLPPARRSDSQAIADALAWAVHCHLDFSGVLESEQGQELLKSCPVQRTPSYACLKGRGRVQIAGIRFEGHTDTVPFVREGEFSNNQDLSEARALRFAAQVMGCTSSLLSQLGEEDLIPFETRGFADRELAEPQGRDPRNRRVEIHFSADGELSSIR